MRHVFVLRPSIRGLYAGTTLVEVMAAIAVLSLLLVVLVSATNLISATTKQATSTVDAFAAARNGFDILSQRLSQATLNTYWDYYDANGNRRNLTNTSFVPATYGRASDLQFLVVQNSQMAGCGQEIYFQTPESFSTTSSYRESHGLLNACGYYVRYGSDATFAPSMMTQVNPVTHQTPASRWRYRLMQALQDTTGFLVYTNAPSDQQSWATTTLAGASASQPLADNIIALIVWPRLPAVDDSTGTNLTPNYLYDSQANTSPNPANNPPQVITANQLPATVQVTLLAIDEPSAARMDTHSSTPPAIITSALQNKFTTSNANQYQVDLYGDGTPANPGVIPTLAAQHINCRVLNATIVLRESQWSQ